MSSFQELSNFIWNEVWVRDDPDHLIHFNGDRFFGPYKLPDNE